MIEISSDIDRFQDNLSLEDCVEIIRNNEGIVFYLDLENNMIYDVPSVYQDVQEVWKVIDELSKSPKRMAILYPKQR